MRKLIQTRLHKEGETKGNCFPTVLACLMDLTSPEDVIQIQECFDEDWVTILDDWLRSKGWEWGRIPGHLFEDKYRHGNRKNREVSED